MIIFCIGFFNSFYLQIGIFLAFSYKENIMKKYFQLFETICKIVDVQIKKYKALATGGVGPDAGMNAALVLKQVEELLKFADILLNQLQKSELDEKLFFAVFNQVHFYVKQEYLRSYAGWLIDENNIHNTVYERVKLYHEDLNKIEIDQSDQYTNNFLPVSEAQKQCEHDSHAIAFKIVNIAVQLRNNPEMELDKGIPEHAQKILRKHVSSSESRYYNPFYLDKIIEVHNKTKDYLEHSSLVKSTDILSLSEAQSKESEHRSIHDALLARFKQIRPDSILFSPEYTGYSIAKINSPKQHSTVAKNNPSFGITKLGLFAVSAIIIASLIYYLVNCQNDNLPAVRKMV